jgi:hypothetical protein
MTILLHQEHIFTNCVRLVVSARLDSEKHTQTSLLKGAGQGNVRSRLKGLITKTTDNVACKSTSLHSVARLVLFVLNMQV